MHRCLGVDVGCRVTESDLGVDCGLGRITEPDKRNIAIATFPPLHRPSHHHNMPFNPRTIKALLIDLSGTLHIGKELTPRAAEAVGRLRKAGVPFIFW